MCACDFYHLRLFLDVNVVTASGYYIGCYFLKNCASYYCLHTVSRSWVRNEPWTNETCVNFTLHFLFLFGPTARIHFQIIKFES